MYITCVSVTLVTQNAKRTRRFILSSVLLFGSTIFSTISHKWQYFRGKKLLKIKRVLTFSKTFVWSISHLGRIQQDMFINVQTCLGNMPIFLLRYEWELNFLDRLSKNALKSNFMKIRLLVFELFHAEGRTDGCTWHDEANSRI